MVGGVYEDEAEGPRWVEGGKQAGDVQDAGVDAGSGVVGGDVDAVVEEGFNIAEAEEGGGRGGEEDYGIGAPAGSGC